MKSMSLEFYTTKELVDELMSRKTFGGLIVHSSTEIRNKRAILKDFVLKSSFDLTTTTNLAEVTLAKLRGTK